MLKLNYEWLSGSVLYHELFLIPAKYNWVACTYVVVLETMLIWGLLARSRVVQLATLAQLALFHIQSLSQIHWFYPLLMASILSWFLLDRMMSRASQGVVNDVSLHVPTSAYAVMALFAICQLVPFLYRGDRALTGQGRIFALHMFEARQICKVIVTTTDGKGNSVVEDIRDDALPPRMICDPIVYYSRIRDRCRAISSEARTLSVVMLSRRTTDLTFRRVIAERSFCTDVRHYAVFTNNAWLH
jgi:hypothetical protein